MRVSWRTQKEVRFLNEVMNRKAELAVDDLAISESKAHRFPGGLYYLLDLTPLGGWKGKSWAIFCWDLADVDVWYFRTREEAEAGWLQAREAAGPRDSEGE